MNDIASSGIGLRSPHYREVTSTLPSVAWWEVHSENFFTLGGLPLQLLTTIRNHYPVSLHGVGLSLGSAGKLNERHLSILKQLVDKIEPSLVSEHISWSAIDGRVASDLLPLPYTEESLSTTVSHISEVQETLGRQILVENPSTYLQFTHSTIPEWEFMVEVASQSGCALLLDVNNIIVSSGNHGFDASHYVSCIPTSLIKEIHLAGHARQEVEGKILLIDDHGSAVPDDVWALYRQVIARTGKVPTLIEWDTNIPPLAILIQEAAKADRIMEQFYENA